MNTRTRNLAVTGGAVLLTLLVFARGQSAVDPGGTPPSRRPAAGAVATATDPVPLATPVPEVSPVGPAAREMHTYAVDISWLKGFPPDAAPGDIFDIWVAWDRSVVKGPNMQLLLEGVLLEKIAPPVTAQGPYVAFLFMTRKQLSDFLYGREYGALSVTRPAG